MKKIIFDIETKNIFADVGSDKAEDLDISVLSLYDSETDKYYSFLEEDFDKMWPFFKNADMLITFNGNHFDIPLLQKYANKENINLKEIYHLDIFEKFREASGKKIGLDSIASTTLGITKSANGLQAVAWWNEGKVDEIIKYCEQDVKVTKDLYDYIYKNQKAYYVDRNTGEKKEVIIDSKNWEELDNVEEDNGMLF